MNREAIYSALWDLVKVTPGFRTTSRILKHWTEVPAPQQPALFMTCGDQTVAWQGMALPKTELPAKLYVYVNTAGKREARPPSAMLNDLLDALDAALAPPSGQAKNTLGGLVDRCRIEGAITTDEGVLGEQAIAIVPISILVP